MKRWHFPYAPAAMKDEVVKARSINYYATNDFEHLVLQADIMKTEENYRVATLLRNAAEEVARARKVCYDAKRTMHLVCKPKKKKNESNKRRIF